MPGSKDLAEKYTATYPVRTDHHSNSYFERRKENGVGDNNEREKIHRMDCNKRSWRRSHAHYSVDLQDGMGGNISIG